MADTAKLFHELSNWHNKISIMAGVNKEMLKNKPLNSLGVGELGDKNSYVIGILEQIEKFVFSADRIAKDIKKIIQPE